MAPFPSLPQVGPFRADVWRSPLRGPWLASVLSSALLPLLLVCAVTGFLSHLAYSPDLGHNAVFRPGSGLGLDVYGLDWPSSPSWLYAATQGAHVISGIAAIPILLAKLWSVIPKLFENPPVLSLSHALERLSLVLLVGGVLFTIATGVLNIQLWYPFGFQFVSAHYYGAVVFLAALVFHVAIKLGVMRRAFSRRGVVAPLRDDLERTEPEEGLEGVVTSAPVRPGRPTLTRRALLAGVGGTSLGLGLMTAGQVVGGPLRPLALLAPRNRGFGDGPNDFAVNKAFASVGIRRSEVGPGWRLALHAGDERGAVLSREQLLELEQATAELPIACVEGWSTTQSWTGVRLSELARLAGLPGAGEVEVRVAPAARDLPPRDAQLRTDRDPRLAARPARQRRGPVARPRLPGSRDRAGAPRRPLHQVGGRDVVPRVTRFRERYGAGPLHLLALLATLAVAAYAFSRVFELLGKPFNFVLWFAGAIVAHDLVLYPLYTLLGRGAQRMLGPSTPLRIAALNHLRVPALVSGLLLLVWLPLVIGKGDRSYKGATGLTKGDLYLDRWLILSAALFAVSALVFAVRARRLAGRT